jgi:predicted acylesterase/phospholipase RssA
MICFPRRFAGIIFVILAGLQLGACATQRPIGRNCSFAQVAYASGVSDDKHDKTEAMDFQRLLKNAAEKRNAGMPSNKDPWQWLVLSGGGQWGAFGAGFLKGWSEYGDRPAFDIVTGVSTGALIAPYAFLGKPYDEALLSAFRIASEKELVKRRSWLALISSNSIYNSNALNARILSDIRLHQMVKLLQAEEKSGRRLLIGVVNADNGLFYAVDLTGLAAHDVLPLDAREHCMADYMQASAGMPVALSPTFIENRMLMDGNSRASLLVNDLFTVAQRFDTRAVNIYVIKNGNVRIRQETVKNRISSIAARSAEIILDQMGDTNLRAIIEQPRLGSQARFVTADHTKCDPDTPDVRSKFFAPSFMLCLTEEGRRIGNLGELRWVKNMAATTK